MGGSLRSDFWIIIFDPDVIHFGINLAGLYVIRKLNIQNIKYFLFGTLIINREGTFNSSLEIPFHPVGRTQEYFLIPIVEK